MGCKWESAIEEPRFIGVPGPWAIGVGKVSIDAENESGGWEVGLRFEIFGLMSRLWWLLPDEPPLSRTLCGLWVGVSFGRSLVRGGGREGGANDGGGIEPIAGLCGIAKGENSIFS